MMITFLQQNKMKKYEYSVIDNQKRATHFYDNDGPIQLITNLPTANQQDIEPLDLPNFDEIKEPKQDDKNTPLDLPSVL